VGELATIYVDPYYEGGIYQISLKGGQYGPRFGNYWGDSIWYDSDGNEITFTSSNAWLEEGTYYIHIVEVGEIDEPLINDTFKVIKYAKLLDVENENVIIPDRYDEYPEDREHLLADWHDDGDRFVIFYSIGENQDVLGQSITFYRYGGGAINLESIEFYDVNGHQLPITYDDPDMVHDEGVTAIGGVYIVIVMNGEGVDLYFSAC
jgi:hypothetical protein